ncbi:hypothetical protein QQ045_023016 [Rhodiola kirilowii]
MTIRNHLRSTALMDFYSKCGHVDESVMAFAKCWRKPLQGEFTINVDGSWRSSEGMMGLCWSRVYIHCGICLWMRSTGAKIAGSELIPLLIKCLSTEDMRVKEAAGGVLANLALSHQLHGVMVEAGVIPKLAQFFTTEVKKGSVTIRKEARKALLELAKI